MNKFRTALLFAFALLYALSAAAYIRVRFNKSDRVVMAYKTDTKLIFRSEDGIMDTLQLRQSKPKLTRFDFALDLGLGRSNGD